MWLGASAACVGTYKDTLQSKRRILSHGGVEQAQLEPASDPGGRACAPLPPCAVQLTPLSPLPAFGSLQRSTARWTGATTTIEAEVASGFSVPILSILDDPTLLELSVGLLPVAARRRGAARRRLWQLWRRSSAAAATGQLWRAARASPAPSAALLSSPTAPAVASACLKKMCMRRCTFLALCVCLCVCLARF